MYHIEGTHIRLLVGGASGQSGGEVREPWLQSEYTVAYALRHRGVKCKNVGHYRRSWDIETQNGLRIDVKDSGLRNNRWTINLRRRGRKKHGTPDFYIVCLRGLIGPNGPTHRAFVVLNAKDYQNQTMLIWTVKSLLMKHASECGAWHRIVEAEAAKANGQFELGAAA